MVTSILPSRFLLRAQRSAMLASSRTVSSAVTPVYAPSRAWKVSRTLFLSNHFSFLSTRAMARSPGAPMLYRVLLSQASLPARAW